MIATLLCAPARRGLAAEALVLDHTIALKDVSGRIDHMAIDLARKRLFVAEPGNGTLDVIDLMAAEVIRRIKGLKEPQVVAYVPGPDILAVANGGDGTVRLFRGADLSPAGIVALSNDADNVRLDPHTGMLVVGYGTGGLAVIDPAKAVLISHIQLPAIRRASSSIQTAAAPSSMCRMHTRSRSSIWSLVGRQRAGSLEVSARISQWRR